MGRQKRRRSAKQRRQLRESIAFWFGLTTGGGQIVFHLVGGVLLSPWGLGFSAIAFFSPAFGRDFVLELARALRGGGGAGE